MKRLFRAMKAAVRAFSYEMKKPKNVEIMTENRRKLMKTWKSINYDVGRRSRY